MPATIVDNLLDTPLQIPFAQSGGGPLRVVTVGPRAHLVLEGIGVAQLGRNVLEVLAARGYIRVKQYENRTQEPRHPAQWWMSGEQCQVAGQSSLSGALTVSTFHLDMVGTVSGAATLSGAVPMNARNNGSATGSATLSAQFPSARKLLGTVSGSSSLTGALTVNRAPSRIVPTNLTSASSNPPFVISSGSVSGSFNGQYGNNYVVFDDTYTQGDNSSILGLQWGFDSGAYGFLKVDTGGSWTLTSYLVNLEEAGFSNLTTGYKFSVYGSNDNSVWTLVDAEDITTGDPVRADHTYNVAASGPWRYFTIRFFRGDPAPGVCQQTKVGKWILYGS